MALAHCSTTLWFAYSAPGLDVVTLCCGTFRDGQYRKINLDGVIWAVKNDDIHQLLPDPLKDKLEHEGAHVFTVPMLAETINSFEELAALSTNPFVVFFEPPSIEDRIINQYAFFSMMSDPTDVMDNWLRDYPELWKRIIIPAELKWEIRDKLDQANINERILFPGLSGLSRWLMRYYSPR